eukprot:CAMPEP_0183443296 /NCGR_PEP_ID=MMETSP0370-20130417/91237_1 /TAXON_ID=268820 /ORGANISM="Peridinium aciculiferum, Strain PAER-2" /LENGTH=34 /DNA_ID= /DNA_START= /DNA_END= /DNA_ORIENTATION=
MTGGTSCAQLQPLESLGLMPIVTDLPSVVVRNFL